MELEVDVSGEDILTKDYSIVVAGNEDCLRGFKFTEKYVQILRSRYGQGHYRYGKSRKQKSLFKIRMYSVIVYYLIKDMNISDKKLKMNICRDFYGHEIDIISNLRYFLEMLLGFEVEFSYIRLSKKSRADEYSRLLRLDKNNLLNCYCEISLEQIENFLKK